VIDLNKAGPAGAARLSELSNRSGKHPSVPVLFVGTRVVQGSGDIKIFLEGGTLTPTPTPGGATSNGTANGTALPPLTPLAVVTAGLVDGINPCAFAVLALLLGTLTVAGTRRQVLLIGAAYILGVFLIYLAAGFGITAIVGAAGLGTPFKILAGVIALAVGLSVLAAAVLQRRELAPAITSRGRERVGGWLERVPTAGPLAAFAIGIGVGLVELPCTGAIYLAVLGMLATGSLADAVPLLVLYNLFFVLPLVLIVGAVAFGLSPRAVDEWRGDRRRLVLAISGIVMVVLGIALLTVELL
jgi:cytochrome c biogenesis protein CcdA